MDQEFFLQTIEDSEHQLEQILTCNQYTKKFGLELSKEDAMILLADRKDSLIRQQRIEFGEGILPALIFAFCDSPYLYQDNYVETIGRLQDIFYLLKNETLDTVSDEDLIRYMKHQFDGVCAGSLDHLEETVAEQCIRSIRKKIRYTRGDA